ncbi:hypothetical protein BC831DRAFT_477263 [Entophlyctis helioformis]|nr:hypothetical protein BC831DRAFT_477263 [Entophlyctis helioformis]
MIGGASEPPPYSPHAGGQPYYTTPQATAHYMAQMQPECSPVFSPMQPYQPTDPQTIPHSRASSVSAPVYPAMYVYQYTQTPDGQTIATPVPVQYAVPQQMPVPVQMQPFGVASAGGSAPPSPRPDGHGPSASASASAGQPSASVYGGPSYDYDRKG